ncbi:MAG: DNA repair protein RadC [Candidatus Tectomicrobia bacterium]|uniref:DNA repair protein RadC n=1 Tax=Tectimicrobiota bacterium TaxID=2528274 RepID=A0A932CQ18_UNCTE|nr:DNA repair protein RadC [Candidatus Tectomicrobia bacterium]
MAQERIKDWPEEERPRERLLQLGPASLSDAQLLAILLRTGDSSSAQSALGLGRVLIKQFGSLQALDAASPAELCSIPGIGPAKTAQVKAALELGKRLMAERGGAKTRFSTSKEVAGRYIPQLGNFKKEIFRSILLDTKNHILREVTISEGSLNASIVHPREVFNPAIKESAAGIIFIHNHPSGDPTPSPEDVELTRRLVEVSKIVGIRVLDHVIIGDNRYFSFRDENLL